MTAIVDDLNRFVELRNVCRLVINRTLTKKFDLDEVIDLHNKSCECMDSLTDIIENLTGKRLIKPDYLLLSKSKNALSFENNHL